MPVNLEDKKMFSPSNVVFIVGLAIHLVASYFILDSKIEKLSLSTDKDKEMINLRLTNLEEQDEIHTLGIETLAKMQASMLRPEEVKPKNYR